MKYRKVLVFSLSIVIVFLMVGCTKETIKTQTNNEQKQFYPFKKDRMFNAAVDAFFAAVDAKDADAIKALFWSKQKILMRRLRNFLLFIQDLHRSVSGMVSIQSRAVVIMESVSVEVVIGLQLCVTIPIIIVIFQWFL